MKSFDDIEKTYCINLKRRPDRREKCTEIFNTNNINVEFMDAVDGTELSHFQHRIQAARVGCIQSHKEILSRIKKNNYKYTLITEDDIAFDCDLKEKFNERCNEIPDDFAILYLGGNNIIPPVPLSQHIGKCRRTLTTHSYIVNIRYIDLLCGAVENETTTNNKMEAIDVLYAFFQMMFPFYIMTPRLTYQRDDFSDIEHVHTGNWAAYQNMKDKV